MNLFWRNTRHEKHRPDDPLNTDPPAPPAPPANPGQGAPLICGGCGCKLARNGDIISTGDNYKKFLKHDRTVEEKDNEISRLTKEVENLKTELAAAKGSGSAHSTRRPVGSFVERS